MISIIIPNHELSLIYNCIKSIYNSEYKDWEMVIVDEGKERSVQRNIGAGRAKGEFLLFLDSDMLIHKFLLWECMEIMNNNKIVALYIPEIIIGMSNLSTIRNFERQFYNGTPIDAVRFIRADKFIKFDETITGLEDWDWDRRIKGQKKITKYNIYHDDGDLTLRNYFNKKRYYMQDYDIFKQRYPKDLAFSFTYRYFKVFMENGKWKQIIRHPVLFVEMFALKIVTGLAFISARKS